MELFIPLSVIALIITAFLKSKKTRTTVKLLEDIRKSQPEFNYYKILPGEVNNIEIDLLGDGRYRITFTPTSIKQLDEILFVIGVKSKHEKGDIGFDLILNGEIQKVYNKETQKEDEFNVIGLDTNSTESDRLLILLAELFNVEISNKSQIVKSLLMITEKQNFELNNIKTKRKFIAYFSDTYQFNSISPGFKFELDIGNNKITIEEIDKLLRPIIVEKLTFVPNIKNRKRL